MKKVVVLSVVLSTMFAMPFARAEENTEEGNAVKPSVESTSASPDKAAVNCDDATSQASASDQKNCKGSDKSADTKETKKTETAVHKESKAKAGAHREQKIKKSVVTHHVPKTKASQQHVKKPR